MNKQIRISISAAAFAVAALALPEAHALDTRKPTKACKGDDCDKAQWGGSLRRRPAPYDPRFPFPSRFGHAKNVIVFIGDGMGVSTVTATRIYSVGLEGELMVDQFPHTALSRTYTTDHFTPDSAGTMTAMMTGVNTNSGVIGYGPKTERNDFNQDGDGERLWTLLEMAERNGMKTGVVSTARITHATPAATYSHVNDRGKENEIALQALPGDATYNRRLGNGIEVIFGGGRRHFLPTDVQDEEGESGKRTDGRDLRQEFQDAGYKYVHNKAGFDALNRTPALGLFERSHMEYEHDRPTDDGGEPSLSEMTVKAIDLLSKGDRRRNRGRRGWWRHWNRPSPGFFLMVESGRIDHAHHAGNAFRAIKDTEEFDRAITEALKMVDLRETLVIVTADHSHVFTMAGYPVRPADELPYAVKSAPEEYKNGDQNNILDVVYRISNGEISKAGDSNNTPYTILGYQNGPGYRGTEARVDPSQDTSPGHRGEPVAGPTAPDYLQEAAVPLSSETHAGEEVAMYAWGPYAHQVRGTVKNTKVFEVAARALGFIR